MEGEDDFQRLAPEFFFSSSSSRTYIYLKNGNRYTSHIVKDSQITRVTQVTINQLRGSNRLKYFIYKHAGIGYKRTQPFISFAVR